MNELQQKLMVDKIRKAVGALRGRKIGLLGLSFKPNTDDVRESPAVRIARLLHRSGARVQAYDPAGAEAARKELKGVQICGSIESAARGTDALVIVTEWNQFRNLDLEKLREVVRKPRLIDLRNIYAPERVREAGWDYVGVGQS